MQAETNSQTFNAESNRSGWALTRIALCTLVMAISCTRPDAPDPPNSSAAAEEIKSVGSTQTGTLKPLPQNTAEHAPRAEEPKTPDLVAAPQPSKENLRAKPPAPDVAANPLPVAIYLANQYQYADKFQTFRVTAQSGNYFNCYYKSRKQSYHHVRLRGDGSAYLDGYLPRDTAGERLYTELQKRDRQLTVTVVTRASTQSEICAGQVEILDFRRGFQFDKLPMGDKLAKARRIENQLARQPARNRPRIAHYIDRRKSYIGAPREFRVRARLDRYFQCKYAGQQRRFYALFLQGDDYKGLRAYLPRTPDSDNLVKWLAVSEGAKLTAKVTVPEDMYDPVCKDQVQILSWSKGWVDSSAAGKP